MGRSMMLLAVCVVCFAVGALADDFVAAPTPKGDTIMLETFESGMGAWVQSTNEKYNGEFAVVKTTFGEVQDSGMQVTAPARHYGISAPMSKPVDPSAKTFVFQYEITMQDGLECGGAYVKLLTDTPELKLAELDGDTPYSIMFGPDKCGTTNKVHLIIRHKNPLTGVIEEKHLEKTPSVKMDKLPHLYTLVLEPNDNTFQILIDNEVAEEGSLFVHFKPPFVPPTDINDPTDKKPEDWVDDAMIADPDSKKPDDWDEDAPLEIEDDEAVMPEGWLVDEPLIVDDPEAEAPDDWDEEEDGEWEAPKIDNPVCQKGPGCGEWKRPSKRNPDYKGAWNAPMVENPAYIGVWKAKQIPNPDYYSDEDPLQNIGKIGAAAVEIWTMSGGITFDNFMLTNDEEVAEDYAEKTWRLKFDIENSKPKAEDATEETSLGAKMENMIRSVLASGPMAPLRETLEPLVDAAIEKAGAFSVGLAIIVLPWVVIILLVTMCCGSSKAPDAVAAAKKTDAPTQDDTAQADEAEAEAEAEVKEEEVLPKKRTTRTQRAN